MILKDKLLFTRAKLNLSQKELAKMLNVSPITINRWENESFKPTKKAEMIFDIFCQKNNISFKE